MDRNVRVARGATADEQLLTSLGLTHLPLSDAERIERIDREMGAGFEALEHLGKAVSVFGSARTPRAHPDYELGRQVGRAVGAEGFAVITGGGPGLMEAANRGAREAGAGSVGLNIRLPREQRINDYVDVAVTFEHFLSAS
jgi:predicted Rossmann-fold nucleotide-binding protein